MEKLKIAARYLLVAAYLLAGTNHFISPEFYLPLIPDYLPEPQAINVASGVLEVVLAILVAFPQTRRMGAIGIILMLICFIPSHLWFIQIGGCVPDGLCVPMWAAWVRILLIHPILILWAWWVR